MAIVVVIIYRSIGFFLGGGSEYFQTLKRMSLASSSLRGAAG